MVALHRSIAIFSILFFALSAFAQPVVNLGNDTTICSGNSVILNAGNPSATFLWSTGATTQTISASITNVYWVDVTDVSGTTRDSISITVLPLSNFSANDTTICSGTRTLTLQNSNPAAHLYLWWDAPSGGNLLTSGASLTQNFSPGTQNYHVEAYSYKQTEHVGFLTNTQPYSNGYFAYADPRGIRFDALQPIVLDSVTVYVNGAVSFDVELRNSANAVILTKSFSLPATGMYKLPLKYFISTGTDYRLVLTNRVGASIFIHHSMPAGVFPFVGTLIRLNTGTPTANNYFYFYDWQVSSLACATARDPMTVTVLQNPSVSLPVDTFHCGSSLTLDVFNSGATYLWSSGQSSSSASFATNGQFSVSASIGSCTAIDTFNVQLLPVSNFSANDTTICSGTRTLTLQNSNPAAHLYLWWDAPSGGNLLTSGASLTQNFSPGTQNYHVEAYSYKQMEHVGFLTNTQPYSNGYFAYTDPRGIRFDALQPIVLDSVTVYVNGAVSFDVELRNSANTVILTKSFSLPATGMYKLPLKYYITTGTDYRLVLTNRVGASIFIHHSMPAGVFPFVGTLIRLNTGTPTANNYFYFYDWQVSSLACATARDPMTVTILQNPSVSLPVDTFHCGSSLTLDVFNSGATYLWSSGQSSSSASFATDGQFSVSASIGSCTAIDTFNVQLLPVSNFSANDTTICSGTRTLNLQNSNPAAHLYLWWDAPSGGNLLTSGASLTQNFSPGTQNYHVEAYSYKQTEHVGFLTNTQPYSNGYFAYTDPRGIRFDALQSIVLDSVTVYVNGAVSFDVELRNSANAVILTKSFSLPTTGMYKLPLKYFISTGTDYRLVLTNRVGASIFIHHSMPAGVFPFVGTLIRLNSGTPTANNYFYFYDWQVSSLACATARDPMTVTVLQNPSVDFPTDTLHCGNALTLDVFNSGATYLWSTGETNSSITLLQNTAVNVRVAIGICTAFDTMAVSLLDTAVFTVSDTTVCGGNITLAVQGASNAYFYWWNAPTGGSLYQIGHTFQSLMIDTTTFYIEGRTAAATYNVGIPAPNGSFFPILNTRGQTFNVTEEVIVDSITVHAFGTLTTTLEIRNAANNVLYSYPLQLVNGSNTIKLEAYLLPGNGYKIQLVNPVGTGELYINLPVTYPLNYGPIVFTQGFPNTTHYHYFFDWKVKKLACPTQRKPLTVNVEPTPFIFWPEDSVVCANSLLLDATYAGATYLWSNAATSPSITIAQNDTVWVEIAIGACTVSDTMEIILTNPPTIISVQNDTTVCAGAITLYADSDGYTLAWYSSLGATNPIAYGDSLSVAVTDTATFWVEGVQFLPKSDYYGIVSHPVFGGVYSDIAASNYLTRGIVFDVFETILINHFSIYVDAATTGTIKLKDKFGFTIYSQNVQMNTVGENVIALNWLLTADTDYVITLENISGGRVYIVNSFSFPLSYSEMRFNYGFPAVLGGNYSYFFKWRISSLGCATTRIPVTVNVPEYPEITMSSDTTICNGTAVTVQATEPIPSYQYAWSSGESTNSVTFLSQGIYTVTVSNNGACTSSKSVLVQFPVPPAAINTPDMSICSPQTVNLLTNPNDALLIWYALPGSTNPIYISAPYNTYIADTTTYRLEVGARVSTRLGVTDYPTPANSSLYQNFILANTFDVYTPTVLDSVAVYIDVPSATFDIILQDAFGVELRRRTVSVNQARTKAFVPLDFVLLPGTGYKLMFGNIGTTNFLIDNTVAYPQGSSAAVAALTGTVFSGVVYNCFFDWHFSYALVGCYAPQADTFMVAIQLPVNMPDSVFTCDSITLDAQVPAALAYTWNTGAITSSIQVNTPGLYTVTVSAGGACSMEDTVWVEMPQPLGLPQNGVVCGTVLSSGYDSQTASAFLWSTGETTDAIIISGPATYVVTVTTTEGCILIDSANITTLETPPAVNLGSVLNICFSDTLDAGYGGQGMSYLWNTGESTQQLVVMAQGNYEVTVTSPNGCSGSDNVWVALEPLPTASFTYTSGGGTTFSFTNTSQNWNALWWDFGDETTTTFVSPFHLYPSAGCYEVMLIASNQCGADTTYAIVPVLVVDSICNPTAIGYAHQNTLELTIAPNPNEGHFDLLFSTENNTDEKANMQVFGADGRLLYEQQYYLSAGTPRLEVELPYMPAGYYWIKWQQASGTQVAKLVILH